MSSEVEVRVLHGTAAAREFLLRHRRLEETELPERVRVGIREVFGTDLSAAEVVERIIADVRREGDDALRHYTRALDHAEVGALEIPRHEIAAARERVPRAIFDALMVARDQIERFHRHQLRTSWVNFTDDGALGQLLRPMERVGVYTPAGRNPYPSSLLMSAVPARVAGVSEIVACAPPEPDGGVSPLILAAADVAGVDRFFRVGGAQAIAALAYGTASVPRVDKIVGPGNLFVVLAKRRVYGEVDIDQLPGPTETLLIADETADPPLCAADLLAQAEHDPLASAILITTSARLATSVQQELGAQLPGLGRAGIAAESLAANGAIAVVDRLEDAFDLANAYAPEHLCLLIANPWEQIDRVKHAGGVFVGESSPEVLGDYAAGPSHVMPTGQTARFSSPINVEEFLKIISVIGVNRRGLNRLGPVAAALARAEGLTAHAAAVERRLERLRPN
ncbi:MAG TPA: histidinol dehydrogenase [Thermomicrobiaceae bacterium]|nr:histidinol dehydrogenase [Thermomicrobiaceae bacterium]